MPTSANMPVVISILLIVTAMCYLIIGFSILKADRKSILRRLYMLACVCLSVWSSFYGALTVTLYPGALMPFWAIGFFFSALFFPAWLHFLLHLADYRGPYRTRWLIFFYGVSAVLAVSCILSRGVTFRTTELGNQFEYGSIFFKIMVVYNFALLVIISLLQLKWLLDARLRRQRRQALVFVLMTFIIIPPGLLFDFIFPAFFQKTILPLTTPLVLLVSLQLYYTMMSTRGLSITVENAAHIIFKSVTMPVLLLSHSNEIVLANNAAQAFWDTEHGKLVGSNISELVALNGEPPDQDRFRESFEGLTVTVRSSSGPRVCDMLLTVSRDKYGDVLNKVAVLRDVTEMLGALAQAQDASRAKSDFLSRMSHEIRTPMNAIIGMTKIGLNATDADRMRYCLGRIDAASEHMLSLINDILDMSKIESGKLDLHEETFNLEKTLETICSVMAVKAEEKRLDFVVDIDPMSGDVVGDELRFSQVVSNLLSNAIKFTPERGTVWLKAWLDSPEGEDESRVHAEISDTGIGLSPEQMSRLFTSFEQADGSIARRFGGTGLGLVISKSIVELMGGSIGVESEPGKGSRFHFTVKLRRGGATRRSRYNPAICEGLRVLVVDDSPETLQYFKRFLAQLGAECVLADNGADAVELARSSAKSGRPFHMAFIDYLMEDLDGIETARRIGALSRPTRLIMMSASEWSEIEGEATQAGVCRFLPKPLFNSSIFNVIKELTTGSQPAEKPSAHAAGKLSFPPCRILLAEDIEINREIVLTLLEDSGLEIDCAEDGGQAVEMFAAAPDRYALILMDIQMPHVDGLTATRRIRGLNALRARTVPIIAMTANAFREDVAACLEAGMDDHVGKPIDVDDLVGKLKKHLPVIL